MLSMRLMGALLGCMVINLNMTTCRSSGEGDKSASSPPPSKPAGPVELPGIDTSQLTAREKAQWSAHVTELLAPCPETPENIAECVKEDEGCDACRPAAEYLLTQVRQGKTHGQAEAAFEARFSQQAKKNIEIGDSPIKGPPDAPITVIEFADFECPACRAAAPALDAVIEETDDVRLVFKNFPLNIHPHAEKAARAAVAAGRQGKFWEMHHALFSMDPPLTPERLKQVAQKLSLDMEKFDEDLRSESVADAVAADRKLGERVDLSATPTIFINGRRFDYQSDLKTEMLQWIELERELLELEEEASAGEKNP